MAYQPDPEDLAFAKQEFAGIDRERKRLRRRAGLDPRNPDALDEEEVNRLSELESAEA